MTRRRGRRRKKLLDDLKDRRGYSHLKEEALDRTMWGNRFRRGFGPVVRQNTEWTNFSSHPKVRFPVTKGLREFPIYTRMLQTPKGAVRGAIITCNTPFGLFPANNYRWRDNITSFQFWKCQRTFITLFIYFYVHVTVHRNKCLYNETN